MHSTDPLGAEVNNRTRLFAIRDVARLAGVSIMTVRRWIDDHGLQVHRLGRLVRISQVDLETFFQGKRDDR